MRQDDRDNPTRLTYWYPRIHGLVPTPRTEIIHGFHTLDAIGGFEDGEADHRERVMAVGTKCHEAALRLGGYPVFLRTDVTSSKHSWKETCFVGAPGGPDAMTGHLASIAIDAECGWAPYSYAAVVRELLPTRPAFVAFHGEMPVTRERRYFAYRGRTICHHPYWPKEALRGNVRGAYRNALAALNEEPEHEVELLTEMSNRVSRHLPEHAWSIDWLHTERGWFLIDMAVAQESFHWHGCRSMAGGDARP